MSETQGVLTTDEVAAWVDLLATLDRNVDDAERVCQLGLLESVKAAAAAAQARVAVAFDASQRQAQQARGMPVAKLGAGSPSRWRWRGGSRPPMVVGIWGWPRRW